jgi:hypothetical protein
VTEVSSAGDAAAVATYGSLVEGGAVDCGGAARGGAAGGRLETFRGFGGLVVDVVGT